MCCIEKFQLNATHGTAMTIGCQNALPEIHVAQDSPRRHKGVLTLRRNLASNFVVFDVGRIFSNLIEQTSFPWENSTAMQVFQILDVSADEVRPKRYGYLSIPFGVSGEATDMCGS